MSVLPRQKPEEIRKGTRTPEMGVRAQGIPGNIPPGSVVCYDMGHFGGCFPGCKETAANSKDGEPTEFSIRSIASVPRSSRGLKCTCGSTAITCAYGWTRRRSREKGWEAWDSTDTCRSSTEESSCPGKPSEDGVFSLFSNTFVYPSQG